MISSLREAAPRIVRAGERVCTHREDAGSWLLSRDAAAHCSDLAGELLRRIVHLRQKSFSFVTERSRSGRSGVR